MAVTPSLVSFPKGNAEAINIAGHAKNGNKGDQGKDAVGISVIKKQQGTTAHIEGRKADMKKCKAGVDDIPGFSPAVIMIRKDGNWSSNCLQRAIFLKSTVYLLWTL